MSSSSDRPASSSFSQFLHLQTDCHPDGVKVHQILGSIASACSDINGLMRRISLNKMDGLHRNAEGNINTNIQGEAQQKLDVISNDIMKTAVCRTGHVALVASEEDEATCLCTEVISGSVCTGDYVAVFDPLDGSLNVDSGLPTGTIFGIYRSPQSGYSDHAATAAQCGKELVAAGYCLYSAATHLVITLRRGVHMFGLDDESGQFYLTKSNMQIPSTGSLYSFNDAHSSSWGIGLSKFVDDFKKNAIPGVMLKKPSARYMGALVADAHNVLLNGGVFGYPATPDMPSGKLRLVYEANPLAAVIEDAGGAATNGHSRILDIGVHQIHQRTPLFLGNKNIVDALEKYIS